MKTINQSFVKTTFKFALVAVFFLAFSCSQDSVLNSDNLESAKARSKSKNDKKSGNAVLKKAS